MKTHVTAPLQTHVTCLGRKEIYCSFRTQCIISILFSTNCRLFQNFIFLCSNNPHASHERCAKI